MDKPRLRATVSKDPGYDNEDYYTYRTHEGIYVLCDGASESFDACEWAKILAKTVREHRTPSVAALSKARKAFRSKYAEIQLGWAAQLAFDRGSFSSLLVADVRESLESIHVTAIGDSILALIDGEQLIQTFPYSNSQQFLQRPLLLSSNSSHDPWPPDQGCGPEFSRDLS